MADNLRQIAAVVDTDRFTAKDFTGSPLSSVQVVNGDTILFAFHFQRTNYSTGALEDLNLSAGGAPLALRFTCRATRSPSAATLTFQDTYNQGDLAAFEDLAKGQITFRVSFNDADIDTLLATADSADTWLEITYLSAGSLPQTLYQRRLTIVQQLDNGAVGTPPPTSPTYLTAAEIALAYQPLDAELTALAGLTSAANKLPYFTGSGTAALADYTASARTFDALTAVAGDLVYASGAATWARLAKGTDGHVLWLASGLPAWASLATVGIQPLDSELTALAGLTSAADKLPYFTGSGTAALADFGASARTLTALTAVAGDLVYASGAATWARLAKSTDGYVLWLASGLPAWASLATVGIQPLDSELTALAGLTSAANKLPYFTGAGTAALADYTASARTFDALTAVAGDLPYASGAATWAALAGNTTATKKYLSQTGTGSASAAPVWSQPAFSELSDVPAYTGNASKYIRINAATNALEAVAAQAHIADPTGGTTVDAEARTAIGSILTALETLNLLATS
jgi:hypothetical protein